MEWGRTGDFAFRKCPPLVPLAVDCVPALAGVDHMPRLRKRVLDAAEASEGLATFLFSLVDALGEHFGMAPHELVSVPLFTMLRLKDSSHKIRHLLDEGLCIVAARVQPAPPPPDFGGEICRISLTTMCVVFVWHCEGGGVWLVDVGRAPYAAVRRALSCVHPSWCLHGNAARACARTRAWSRRPGRGCRARTVLAPGATPRRVGAG